MKELIKADWWKCSEGHEEEHAMRDFCSTCAPYWDNVPICPVHKRKLIETKQKVYDRTKAKGWCRDCKKHYSLIK